jgi:hypothetical protein
MRDFCLMISSQYKVHFYVNIGLSRQQRRLHEMITQQKLTKAIKWQCVNKLTYLKVYGCQYSKTERSYCCPNPKPQGIETV